MMWIICLFLSDLRDTLRLGSDRQGHQASMLIILHFLFPAFPLTVFDRKWENLTCCLLIYRAKMSSSSRTQKHLKHILIPSRWPWCKLPIVQGNWDSYIPGQVRRTQIMFTSHLAHWCQWFVLWFVSSGCLITNPFTGKGVKYQCSVKGPCATTRCITCPYPWLMH